MRVTLFIVALTLIPINANSQDSVYSKLFTDAIYTLRGKPTIYYVDSSLNFYGKFSRFAKKKIVHGYSDLRSSKKTPMKFIRSELREIDRVTLAQSSKLWPENLMENSIRLPYDSLESFIKATYNPKNPGRDKQHFYLISQPVFIRNNTVAILRIADMVGIWYGYDNVIIFTWDDQKWKHKMTIRAGAW